MKTLKLVLGSIAATGLVLACSSTAVPTPTTTTADAGKDAAVAKTPVRSKDGGTVKPSSKPGASTTGGKPTAKPGAKGPTTSPSKKPNPTSDPICAGVADNVAACVSTTELAFCFDQKFYSLDCNAYAQEVKAALGFDGTMTGACFETDTNVDCLICAADDTTTICCDAEGTICCDDTGDCFDPA